ncbi:hypothetical protein RHMOL_Rhmol01G0214600 [Rhododendron molle]|uniref:Uncharacterized protein n=1 Tax=Rhododendron molle TaxID=49168 RepID=A0ACC0Q7C1_RHOML|nr:hypothetical protein RHMOL_Rhmol01G0214600 [Rhododendron molle]
MEMVVKRRDAMEKCKGDICPKIFKIVEKLKSHVGEWIITYTSNGKHQLWTPMLMGPHESNDQWKVAMDHLGPHQSKDHLGPQMDFKPQQLAFQLSDWQQLWCGPSGMTVDGGQPHSGTKLPVRRKMKVVEKRPAQVVEIGSSEVLETGPIQSSITTQLQGKGKRVQNKMMWLGMQ